MNDNFKLPYDIPIYVGECEELNAWYYTPRAQLMQAKATSLKITAAMKFGYIEPKEKADPKEDGDKDEK